MQQAFPGTALPANVVVKAPDVNAPAVRAGDRAARAAGARERPDARADHGRRQRRPARSRTSPSRSTATGTDAASNASLALLRDEIVPKTVGALPNAEAGVTGLDRPVEGRHRRDEVEAARSSSRSCSCSRSR